MGETKPHILIIDDDPSILEVMRLILEEEGKYRITTTETIFEGVAEVEQLQPDLLLLDFLMHGRRTAWTLLHTLKLYRPTKDIPIVLCTAGLLDIKEQEPIFPPKDIPIIYKPFDMDELLHVVEQMLSSSSSHTAYSLYAW